MIDEQAAQAVKDAVDIVDFMRASGVKLFGSGDELSARCPFHGEDRRPSMSVSRSKGLFFCHACGASGDALDFAARMNGRSGAHGDGFRDALSELSRFAGLDAAGPLPFARRPARVSAPKPKAKPKANDAVIPPLPGAEAEAKRMAEALRAQVDFSGPEPKPMTQAAKAVFGRFGSWERAQALQAGLGSDGPLAGRFVFPIRRKDGRIVGFAGRTLDPAAKPKYINTKFKKSAMLFGDADFAAAGYVGPVVLAEGYFDSITPRRYSKIPFLSIMGASPSPEQIARAFEVSRDVYLWFDADAAGESATRRAIELSEPWLREGASIRVLTPMFPSLHDPDEAFNAGAAADLAQAMREAPSGAEWLGRGKTKDDKPKETAQDEATKRPSAEQSGRDAADAKTADGIRRAGDAAFLAAMGAMLLSGDASPAKAKDKAQRWLERPGGIDEGQSAAFDLLLESVGADGATARQAGEGFVSALGEARKRALGEAEEAAQNGDKARAAASRRMASALGKVAQGAAKTAKAG